MKTLHILLFSSIAGALALLGTGCASSSALTTGPAKYAATQADAVEVLVEFPEAYETVGLVEASAPKGYLRKPQHATQMAIAALKKEAANLGAHAVVLKDYSSERVPDFSLGGDGEELGLLFNTEHKHVTAVAIRLK